MFQIKLAVCGVVAAAGVAGASAAALASPAQTPAPTPGAPSCNGLIVATFNHNSGAAGHSGNPNASGGPGEFLGPATHDAIEAARAANC